MRHVAHEGIHALLLTEDEFAAVKHALVRFAMTPMAEIKEGHERSPSSPLWRNWRTAQTLDRQLLR